METDLADSEDTRRVHIKRKEQPYRGREIALKEPEVGGSLISLDLQKGSLFVGIGGKRPPGKWRGLKKEKVIGLLKPIEEILGDSQSYEISK